MIAKRRIALLRTLGRPSEAITALTALLDSAPSDIEAWAELSELYASISMFPQAIFCLEEVVLIAPNAWNVRSPPYTRDSRSDFLTLGPRTTR